MRRGWNGITISRDTIHIEGVKLGTRTPTPVKHTNTRPLMHNKPFLPYIQ